MKKNKNSLLVFGAVLTLALFGHSFNDLAASLIAQSFLEEEGEFQTKLPCDLSYMVADIKFNHVDGVQICEIQTGRASRFVGFDYIYQGEGLIAHELLYYLSQYQNKGWFIDSDVRDPYTVQELISYGWKSYAGKSELLEDPNFVEESGRPVFDPTCIHDYNGILFARRNSLGAFKEFVKEHPGVVILDAATFDFCGDKLKTNKLFSTHASLIKIKPKWNDYPRQYSETLAETIIEELGSKIVVIKPRRSAKGYGVIIVRSEDLDATLKYILTGSIDLIYDPDPSYRYWAYDKSESFIVEEYIHSDPVIVPHLNNMEYDGTMRVVFLMSYSEGKFDIHFLGSYWKLPEKSLSEEGNLNDKHKSCGNIPFFCEVDTETFEAVQSQMKEGIIQLYLEMLEDNNRENVLLEKSSA